MKTGVPPLVVGNWKMNPLSVSLSTKLAHELSKGLRAIRDVDVVVAPPFVYLDRVNAIREHDRVYLLGAQDVHSEKLGAYTGEISTEMLTDLGVRYVILGHSERRALGESDEMVNRKLLAAMRAGVTGIVCVGEKTRDHGAHYFSMIETQIRKACANLSKAKLDRLVIAYEPIWAIGTGNTATPEDVHEMRLFIEKVLADIYGRNLAKKVRILYGGSVTAKNTAELFIAGDVDGFLVGGASLHADEFVRIVQLVRTP